MGPATVVRTRLNSSMRVDEGPVWQQFSFGEARFDSFRRTRFGIWMFWGPDSTVFFRLESLRRGHSGRWMLGNVGPIWQQGHSTTDRTRFSDFFARPFAILMKLGLSGSFRP